MADGKTLAKAYVQMIPTTKGFTSALTGDLSGSMDETGSSMGNRLASGIIKALAAAGIGMAIKSVIGSAVSEGAALEQSIGGIKTLFGTSEMSLQEYAASVGQSVEQVKGKYESLGRAEQTMLNNAKQAYRTAGLSANDYMEQVSGFSASLVSSMGGNTEAAAKVADRIMVDMSDNANKMGTDIGLIQNAYQGFAKQNYTMLDNLKLGYGGTQQEMQRLIKDASAMTSAQEKLGVSVDANSMSFENIANAISVVQEQMHIAGTTEAEAAATFSGSLQMMKSAWKNVLGYMANGMYPEMMESISSLIDSGFTFLFENALPMIGRVLSSLPSALASGLSGIADKIGELSLEGVDEVANRLAEGIPQLIAAVVKLGAAVFNWIRSNLPKIKQIAVDAFHAFMDSIREQSPELANVIEGLLPMIQGVLKGVAAFKIGSKILSLVQTAKGAFDSLGGFIKPLTSAFTSAGGGLSGLKAAFVAINGPVAAVTAVVGVLVGAFMTLWKTNEDFRNTMTGIWNELKGAFEEFAQGLLDRINSLGFSFENFSEVISAVWTGLCEFLAPIFEGVWQQISDKLQTAFDLILTVFDTFKALFSGDWDGFWEGIRSIVSILWESINQTFQNALNTITSCVQVFLSWFGIEWDGNLEGIRQTWDTIWTSIQQFIDGTVSFIREIVAGFIALFNGDWDGFCSHLSTAWSGLWDGVKNFASQLWDNIKTLAQEAFEKIKTAIVEVWDNTKKKLEEGWGKVKDNLARLWENIRAKAVEIFNKIKDAIVKPFEDAKRTVQGIWDWLTGHSEVNVKVNTPNGSSISGSVPQGGGGGGGTLKMASGGIFRSATFFPDRFGGSGKIVGEAGAEAVLPLAGFYKELDRSIQSGYSRPNPETEQMIMLLEELVRKPTNVYINKNKLIGEIASDIDEWNKRRSRTLSFVGGVR